jgi:hypothetical protein
MEKFSEIEEKYFSAVNNEKKVYDTRSFVC